MATVEETAKAIKVLGVHVREMDRQAIKALAKATAEQACREYAEAMRDAPTTGVFPEGWGTQERKDGWTPRQRAAVQLVESVIRGIGGEWTPSLIRHAFGTGEGPETWRVVHRTATTVSSVVSCAVESRKVVVDEIPAETKDVAVAGLGATVPLFISAMGLDWPAYAEMNLRRFMGVLRQTIQATNWAFPKEDL